MKENLLLLFFVGFLFAFLSTLYYVIEGLLRALRITRKPIYYTTEAKVFTSNRIQRKGKNEDVYINGKEYTKYNPDIIWYQIETIFDFEDFRGNKWRGVDDKKYGYKFGEVVRVTYDINDPTHSYIGEYRKPASSFPVWIILIISIVIMIACFGGLMHISGAEILEKF